MILARYMGVGAFVVKIRSAPRLSTTLRIVTVSFIEDTAFVLAHQTKGIRTACHVPYQNTLLTAPQFAGFPYRIPVYTRPLALTGNTRAGATTNGRLRFGLLPAVYHHSAVLGSTKLDALNTAQECARLADLPGQRFPPTTRDVIGAAAKAPVLEVG